MLSVPLVICKLIKHALQILIWIFMNRPAILYWPFANGNLHQCQALQRVALKIKNRWLNRILCSFLYSASATVQVYSSNSSAEQLCCPLVNISLFLGGKQFHDSSVAEQNTTSGVSWLPNALYVHYWPGPGLPRLKAIVVIPKNQPLPKHLRKKTSKSAKHACHYAPKKKDPLK